MKIGDYVRTKDGIARYKEDFPNIYNKIRHYADGNCIRGCYCFDDEDIIKTSPNIIDLIEAGDYVNGERVAFVNRFEDNYYIKGEGSNSFEIDIEHEKDIKSIVTREQYSSMEYKLGDK